MSYVDFQLSQPALGNQFQEDITLNEILTKYFPSSNLSTNFQQEILSDLTKFGQLVASPKLLNLCKEADNQTPKLYNYNAWQKRIDEIEVSSAWKELHKISANEGLVAIGYDKDKFKSFARIYQFCKLYLFDPSSAVYTCPLAMTDGAARLFEVLLSDSKYKGIVADKRRRELMKEIQNHLTSRKEDEFWTSGQWMTEKSGGSDVSGTSTVAIPTSNGNDEFDFELFGFKWFTSATTSEITLTLAKIKDPKTNQVDSELSLFLIPNIERERLQNNIKVFKLKNKLGTKALPTAELELNKVKAVLLSPRKEGIKYISIMMNMTRLYNSICAVAKMRRMVAIIQDFSTKRKISRRNEFLSDNSLYLHVLSKLVVETSSCLIFVMDCIQKLGKEECNELSVNEQLVLRLMIPVVKLYTGKKSINLITEGIESIGGQGYMEDTGIPVLERDAQVLSIWEGTTNILSLDVLRVLAHPTSGKKVLLAWKELIQSLKVVDKETENYKQLLVKAQDQIIQYLMENGTNQLVLTTFARELAFSIAHIQISYLLLEHYILLGKKTRNLEILKGFMEEHALIILPTNEKIRNVKEIISNEKLVALELDGYKTPQDKKSKL
ncbi:hypothetical protein ABK040_010441 [Willaertia magna]